MGAAVFISWLCSKWPLAHSALRLPPDAKEVLAAGALVAHGY